MTSYRMYEWFVSMFEPYPLWPNSILAHIIMWIGAESSCFLECFTNFPVYFGTVSGKHIHLIELQNSSTVESPHHILNVSAPPPPPRERERHYVVSTGLGLYNFCYLHRVLKINIVHTFHWIYFILYNGINDTKVGISLGKINL